MIIIFYNKKRKTKLTSKSWPFDKDDVAKLLWIDNPHLDSNKDWKINLYFKRLSDGSIKKCTDSWGLLKTLRIGSLTRGGNLLNDESDFVDTQYYQQFNSDITDFVFNDINFECKVGKYELKADTGTCEIQSNSFIAVYEGIEYHIPAIEVLRSILIRSKKSAYAILEPFGLSYYLDVKRDDIDHSNVFMIFTKNYPVSLVLDETNCNHLLWVTINYRAKKSWDSVYHNLNKLKSGIVFPFPLKGLFTLTCRYRQSDNIIRIEEIIRVQGIEHGINKAFIVHPLLNEYKKSSGTKEKEYQYIPNPEIIIDSDERGAKKKENFLELQMTELNYCNGVEFTKKYTKTSYYNTQRDDDTKSISIFDEKLSTASDYGGTDLLEGIEYKKAENQLEMIGELNGFMKMLEHLKNNYPDVDLSYFLMDLPKKHNKKFAFLDNSVTLRKCLVAEIRLSSKITVLLEIERYGYSLSTLLINTKMDCADRELIVNKLLEHLVDKGGKWDTILLNELIQNGCEIVRMKHLSKKRTIESLAERLYYKLI